MRRHHWFWLAAALLVLAVVGYNLFGYYSYAGYWRNGFYGPMSGMMYWMHGPGGPMGWGWWSPLWTLLIIGLVVLVIYLLMGPRAGNGGPRGDGGPCGHGGQRRHGGLCPRCGRPSESDWRVCPYCGEPLKGDNRP